MKKIWLLKGWLIVLNAILFISSIFTGETSTAVILGILLGLYGLGVYLEKKEQN